jgi:hypothetical protein
VVGEEVGHGAEKEEEEKLRMMSKLGATARHLRRWRSQIRRSMRMGASEEWMCVCVCVALNPECASVLPHSGLRMFITAGPSIRRLVSPSVIHPSRMAPVLALSTASTYGVPGLAVSRPRRETLFRKVAAAQPRAGSMRDIGG